MTQNLGINGHLHYLHYTFDQYTCLNCGDPEPLVSDMSI